MAIGTALAVSQAGMEIYKYIQKRGKAMKRFGQTEVGRHLRTLSKRGIYSGKAKAEILGGVGKVAGNVEQQRRARMRGYLASRGMLGSIASVKTLEEPSIETARIVSGAKSKIEIENELSKAQALREYAALRTDWQERRRLEKRGDVSKLATDIVGAGVTGFQAYMQEKQLGLQERRLDLTEEQAKSMAEYRGAMAEYYENLGKGKEPSEGMSALKRLVDAGEITQIEADSIIAGIKKFPTPREPREPSAQEMALKRLVESGKLTQTEADSIIGKIEKEEFEGPSWMHPKVLATSEGMAYFRKQIGEKSPKERLQILRDTAIRAYNAVDMETYEEIREEIRKLEESLGRRKPEEKPIWEY